MPWAPKRHSLSTPDEKHWRSRQVSYRGWYNLAIWKRPGTGLRALALAENPLCVACKDKGHYEPATEVDHKIPHRGDWELFTDFDNLMPLCKACHSRKTMAENS